MTGMLILGLIIFLGFISGEAAKKLGLPKVGKYRRAAIA